MKMEHVNLTVTDLDRSLAFYEHLLGWRVRWSGAGPWGRVAHVGDDQGYLALVEVGADEDGSATPSGGRLHYNHIGFVVDDLDVVRQRVRETGAEITSEQAYDPGVHLYVLDPDGYELELVSYAADELVVPAA